LLWFIDKCHFDSSLKDVFLFVIIVIVIPEEINRTPFHVKAGKCPSVVTGLSGVQKQILWDALETDCMSISSFTR